MVTMNFKKYKGISDKEYIFALKDGDNELVHAFFYEELNVLLSRIKFDLFHGKVEYDELVSELYLYLSANGWSKLDSFAGKNGCHLKTWMSPVAWRFFIKEYERLVLQESSDEELEDTEMGCGLEQSIEMNVDVESVLEAMPNERYAEIIELMVLKGYPADEVAAMLHTNVANVYNIKHRAVSQFIEYYKK